MVQIIRTLGIDFDRSKNLSSFYLRATSVFIDSRIRIGGNKRAEKTAFKVDLQLNRIFYGTFISHLKAIWRYETAEPTFYECEYYHC